MNREDKMINTDFCENSVSVNGIEIAYQRYGNQQHPAILLIHGLGVPLSAWPKSMVEQLVEHDFQVLLLDNRDVGRSQRLNQLKMPNLLWTLLKLKLGFQIRVPYQLKDMMQDTLGLLDELKLEKVHVVGASMGGMIAQLLTIHHPERVSTLTSIMSTTGNKKLPKMSEKVKQNFAAKPVSNSPEDLLSFHIKKWQVIGSPNYPSEINYLTNYVKGLLDRGLTTKGTLRQMLAVMATDNREELLVNIKTPTLVIHGDSDELIHVDCGKATAASIPNATLKIYKGMGHDLPTELTPSIVGDIIHHTQEKAETSS